ncbi:MAG: CobD/CbiB family cobalamin biosynthesis protein [Cyanobacteriota bacterium]|nr:CobD/CbiB family cobalamin biosynthesis protein [Cyanobacteriota bacterium]
MASPWLLVLLACGLDRLIGDPHACPHPVQVMGLAITGLRRWAEAWAGDQPWRLRLAGGVLTLLVVGGSLLAGWGLERLAARWPLAGGALLVVALASALAGASLRRAVREVLEALPDLEVARARLAWIVGRDVEGLPEVEILRGAAETASENAVDGLFAPLLWMLLGAALVAAVPAAPGPLALAWAFKAASTLDSMLGYRRGRLRWLGTAGARLDDLLTWPAARLVALSLPLAAGRPWQTARLWRRALADGAADPSPNAGLSQAAYAHAAAVRLGGSNRYGGEWRTKPLLAAEQPAADRHAVGRILALSDRLQLLWLLLPLAFSLQ